jgi:uncharacterized protein (TIGR03437 family)
LIFRKALPPFLLALLCAASLSAQPRLRLSRTSLGPFVTATGSDLPEQRIEAQNAGDGALNLSLASDAAWLEAQAGEPGACASGAGECVPIRLALRTSMLERGTHTASVTVSDRAAVNAPQTVRVTVHVGGGVPDRMDFYLTPGGSETRALVSTQPLSISAVTESGGDWLSVQAIRSPFAPPVYNVTAKHYPGLGEGDYLGWLDVVNSGTMPEETKWVMVTLRVAAAPVVEPVAPLNVRLAAGTPGTVASVPLLNRGTGTLAIEAVEALSESGFLSAEPGEDGRSVRVRLNPGALDPGVYSGEVAVASNAANSPLRIPVRVEIVPQGPPAASVQQAADIATGEAGVAFAPGSVVVLRGEQFTFGEPERAEAAPWPDALAGVQVAVNGGVAAVGRAAQHEAVIQLPMWLEPGEALIQVFRDGEAGNTIAVPVAERAPRIERVGIGDYASAVIDGDGSLAIPAAMGGRPARPGETILLRLAGLGAVEPADDPGGAVPEPVTVVFPLGPVGQGVQVSGLQATLIPGEPGRYALRVTLPPETPRGERVEVQVTIGRWFSNRAQIAVE